ncbi:hypothetical protein BDV95DRAFT_613689 [Massariosphaeria phaeospora]|uniref:Uncharacterized protein n=1 Tax=Massariosphaeria phaeospora TaxID=100035 RepID=A0A7C8MI43_9PLEO|nr:hypothetical protein BDV95DRAFT_613689 [Massariosphaeria phaeospora]
MNIVVSRPKPTLEGMPPEVMDMILTSSVQGPFKNRIDPPTLDATDVGNLRLASHRIRDITAFTLVREQDEFEASGDMLLMLELSLRNFKNLTKVLIDSVEAPYKKPWGTIAIRRQLGEGGDEMNDWPWQRPFFTARSYSCTWHWSPIIEAICAIEDRPNWTVDLTIKGNDLEWEVTQLNVSDVERRVFFSRIRSIAIFNTRKDITEDWVV